MKRILLIILMIILSLGTVQAHASDISQNEKQILPVLIVNNSYSDTRKSMAKTKSELTDILMDQITKSLGEKYNIKQLNNDYNITMSQIRRKVIYLIHLKKPVTLWLC